MSVFLPGYFYSTVLLIELSYQDVLEVTLFSFILPRTYHFHLYSKTFSAQKTFHQLYFLSFLLLLFLKKKIYNSFNKLMVDRSPGRAGRGVGKMAGWVKKVKKTKKYTLPVIQIVTGM